MTSSEQAYLSIVYVQLIGPAFEHNRQCLNRSLREVGIWCICLRSGLRWCSHWNSIASNPMTTYIDVETSDFGVPCSGLPCPLINTGSYIPAGLLRNTPTYFSSTSVRFQHFESAGHGHMKNMLYRLIEKMSDFFTCYTQPSFFPIVFNYFACAVTHFAHCNRYQASRSLSRSCLCCCYKENNL